MTNVITSFTMMRTRSGVTFPRLLGDRCFNRSFKSVRAKFSASPFRNANCVKFCNSEIPSCGPWSFPDGIAAVALFSSSVVSDLTTTGVLLPAGCGSCWRPSSSSWPAKWRRIANSIQASKRSSSILSKFSNVKHKLSKSVSLVSEDFNSLLINR